PSSQRVLSTGHSSVLVLCWAVETLPYVPGRLKSRKEYADVCRAYLVDSGPGSDSTRCLSLQCQEIRGTPGIARDVPMACVGGKAIVLDTQVHILSLDSLVWDSKDYVTRRGKSLPNLPTDPHVHVSHDGLIVLTEKDFSSVPYYSDCGAQYNNPSRTRGIRDQYNTTCVYDPECNRWAECPSQSLVTRYGSFRERVTNCDHAHETVYHGVAPVSTHWGTWFSEAAARQSLAWYHDRRLYLTQEPGSIELGGHRYMTPRMSHIRVCDAVGGVPEDGVQIEQPIALKRPDDPRWQSRGWFSMETPPIPMCVEWCPGICLLFEVGFRVVVCGVSPTLGYPDEGLRWAVMSERDMCLRVRAPSPEPSNYCAD
ncbi:hypothetical protein KIPB_009397, partial [Kipferlia bialata]